MKGNFWQSLPQCQRFGQIGVALGCFVTRLHRVKMRSAVDIESVEHGYLRRVCFIADRKRHVRWMQNLKVIVL